MLPIGPHTGPTEWPSAQLVGEDDVFLWPDTVTDTRLVSASQAEFVAIYPNRGSVSIDTWVSLLDHATEAIDLLAFAGSFLHDAIPDFDDRLLAAAQRGVRVRLLFGDPAGEAAQRRGEEEGIGDLLSARCRLTWNYLEPVLGAHGLEARRHDTTLYASTFRFDDTLLANPHTYGTAASHSPVLHLRRVMGGRLFPTYMTSLRARLGTVRRSLLTMARKDYIDDPDAPAANSVVPSVVAVVLNDQGQLLLIHKTDNDLWALPGGGHEIGESIADTVVREVKEETGYDVEVTGISGTYTNPRHVMAYDDGEVRQQFSICFRARLIGGRPPYEQRVEGGRMGRRRRRSTTYRCTRRCANASVTA